VTGQKSHNSNLKIILTWVMGVLALGFCVGAVIKCWSDFSQYRSPISYGKLILGIFCNLTGYFILGIGWIILVKGIAGPIRFLTAMRSWSYSQVAKYIPGKVLVFVMRVRVCQEDNLPPGKVLAASALEIILCLVSALIIWLASSFMSPPVTGINRFLYLIVLLMLIICLHPKIATSLLRLYYKFRRQLDTVEIPHLSWWSVLKPSGFYLLGWFLYGLGGYFILQSITDGQAQMAVPLHFGVGAFTFAWAVGYLCIFTPGGLGVREGSLLLFLSYYMPVSVAVIVAGLARLCQSGVDLGFAGIWLAVNYVKKRFALSCNKQNCTNKISMS
jgi:hypothetical protein